MKTIVVIPTYDEKDNVRPMAEAVLALNSQPLNTSTTQPSQPQPVSYEVLFVDDNSPDGTGAIIDEMSKTEPRIHCLHRTKKEGLGRAYIAGFREALALGADRVVQMDCDFSHNPKDVPRLVEATVDANFCSRQEKEKKVPIGRDQKIASTECDQKIASTECDQKIASTECDQKIASTSADLAIGSRYVKGGATPGWPLKRRLISRAGGIFIRFMTGMPVCDPTGGFKCWTRATLKALEIEKIESAGYSFQLEMNYRTWKLGRSITEVPISFSDRQKGYSKISPQIAVESLKIAWKLRRF